MNFKPSSFSSGRAGVKINSLKILALIALVIWLQGCATYGDGLSQVKTLATAGDFVTAKQQVAEAIDQSGNDALLYYLEMGLLEHLDKNYKQSNVFLESADKLAESLYTQRIGDVLKVMMTNPRSGPYRGSSHERVFINYLKSVNYLMLAQDARKQGKNPEQLLESARIEARRTNIVLRDIENQQGTYQDSEDEKNTLFSQLHQLFAVLNGDFIDEGRLTYRQDAWVNYMIALSFEKNKEWDNARISYQKSAELYEQGYQVQYGLSKEMIGQAWYDTVRMMKKSGWYKDEWQPQADEKLSKKQIERLEAQVDMAEIVVIESAGLAPEIKELNLVMRIQDKYLIVEPVLTGSEQERLDQLTWFFILYADKGLINMVQNYNEGGLSSTVEGLYSTKHFGIAPLYNIADKIGLVSVLSANPVRVTIPYLAPISRTKPSAGTVNIDGTNYDLYTSESIAHLSLYDHLIHAGDNIQLGVARESLKAVLAQKVVATSGAQYSALFSVLTNIVVASSSQAETRSWLLLPYEVRVRRVAVAPGEHSVILSGIDKTPQTLQLKSGDVEIIKTRKF